MQFGRLRQSALELRVDDWIDAEGNRMAAPLRLADLGDGYKIIFAFQNGCPGCHSRGFPTLRLLQERLAGKSFGFAVIQTVFEPSAENSFEALAANQAHYGLKMPFGHDPVPPGARYPGFMEDYRTAGTPWFTVIDPEGEVVYADFRLDAARFLAALDAEDAEMTRT